MKNPSAFPIFDASQYEGLYGCRDFGMSLLDYFAGKAIATLRRSSTEKAKRRLPEKSILQTLAITN